MTQEFTGTLAVLDAVSGNGIAKSSGLLDNRIEILGTAYYIENWWWFSYEGKIVPYPGGERFTEEELTEKVKKDGFKYYDTGWYRWMTKDYIGRPMWYCYNEKTGQKILICR